MQLKYIMRRLIKNSEGAYILNEMDPACMSCALRIGKTYAHIECPKGLGKMRVTSLSSPQGDISLCSGEAKTTANFKRDAENLLLLIPFANKLAKDIKKHTEEAGEKRYIQLAHNLKGINAHCIQELYDISPKGDYKNVKEAINAVKDTIHENLDETALKFFHLQKYNSMMKVEFLVYERIQKGKVKLSPNYYKIRDVVMKTLHMFFEDFTKKSVHVEIEQNYDRVWLDYESFATALYYLIENATKYIKPYTQLRITFSQSKDCYRVSFIMTSHYLNDSDRLHIFDEGYSGEYAKKEQTSGHGYGMYRAKCLLKQCGSIIDVEYGDSEGLYGDIEYANNVFTVCLPYE